jgi:hypothetical protein
VFKPTVRTQRCRRIMASSAARRLNTTLDPMLRVLCCLLATCGISSARYAGAAEEQHVAIPELIAQPALYHGQTVLVSGQLTIQIEGNEICDVGSGSVANDTWPSSNCIWFQFDDGPWKTDSDMERYERAQTFWNKYSGGAVTVRGIFRSDNTGHLGGWSGAVTSASLVGDSR